MIGAAKRMEFRHDFQSDIDAVGRSTQVPVFLETVLLATGMGFAAIARVTDSRWVTCRAVDRISFGLEPGDELDVESTLCHEVRLSNDEIVIDDVQTDPTYRDHNTPAKYGFRSYISVPIRNADGAFFGTLCAIDPEPRQLKDDRVLGMFRLFAKLIGEGLDADEKLLKMEKAFSRERRLAGVQDQFIAILAHDLRGPVSALGAGLRMLERRGLSADTSEIATLMNGSVQRMAALIENLLDQARKRSGDGIVIERDAAESLEPSLRQIVAELTAVSPDHPIEVTINLPAPINCDRPRIAQLLSNILGNAVTHGSYGEPIQLDVRLEGNTLLLVVANKGKKIPDGLRASLFEPFARGDGRPHGEGLGLGLYIASEIAKGHGGTLDVTSDDALTVFTFRMPNAV